jgi:hypothetical protein
MLLFFFYSVFLILSCAVSVWFYIQNNKSKAYISDLYEKRLENVVSDLELATKDQLIKELFSREDTRMILVRPYNNFNPLSAMPGDIGGLHIECKFIEPKEALLFLRMALEVLARDLMNKDQE